MTQHAPKPHAEAVARLAASWRACLEAATPEAAALARELRRHGSGFADAFYATLLDDPRAARFLSVDQVRGRLHPNLQEWLADLLDAGIADVDRLIATNLQVGVVHARIGIPVDLVNRGTRVLREAMLGWLANSGKEPATVYGAISLINASLDLALESMTLAYTDAQDRSSRAGAAYRLFSLAHNIGTERERQRALLLDWENDLLYALASGDQAGTSGLLSESEFGLWFLHKGVPIIGQSNETDHVRALMAEVDEQLAADRPTAQAVAAIRTRLSAIRKMLASLLERVGELEAGSDALTRLLTRRFLPTVLRHEIDLASTHGHEFSIVVMDMDGFKAINDTHGHDVGDRVLQHVANLLGQAVRSSDYVFRMGGEEFLIVLVGTPEGQAMKIADGLRQRIRQRPMVLNDGSQLQLTASLGVAAYDGHPDYEPLLRRADQAMYAAKRNGRDRVELAPPREYPAQA